MDPILMGKFPRLNLSEIARTGKLGWKLVDALSALNRIKVEGVGSMEGFEVEMRGEPVDLHGLLTRIEDAARELRWELEKKSNGFIKA